MADPKPTPPPYLPYRTFRTFVDSLRQGVPSRIDRSVMPSFSGATQSALIKGLYFLNLISDTGVPTQTLVQLVMSEGAAQQQILQDVLQRAYTFLYGSPDFDIRQASFNQFEERFRLAGVSGDTVRKCSTFFIGAATDAGLEVSRYIASTKRKPRLTSQKRGPRRNSKENAAGPNGTSANDATSSRDADQDATGTLTWAQMLLSKFPSFDPTWPDEVKAKWFDAFDKLMAKGS